MFPLEFLGWSHEIRFFLGSLFLAQISIQQQQQQQQKNQFVVYKIVYGSLAFRSFAFKRYLILDRLLFVWRKLIIITIFSENFLVKYWIIPDKFCEVEIGEFIFSLFLIWCELCPKFLYRLLYILFANIFVWNRKYFLRNQKREFEIWTSNGRHGKEMPMTKRILRFSTWSLSVSRSLFIFQFFTPFVSNHAQSLSF